MLPVGVDRAYRTLKKRISAGRILLCLLAVCVLVAVLGSRFRGSRPEERRHATDLTYMLHGDNVDSGYLKHVIAVLERLGYRRVKNSTDFDLLWSHVYPFGDRLPFSKAFLQRLRPYQKVNHFPGSGYFTNKVDLATSDLKHVPRAFHLPGQKAELLEYARSRPDRMFVQKSNSHRGIKILKIRDMNTDAKGTFVQEYVQNPLLVDGLKFDIGVYAILTSVDPLRVYIYGGDVLLRFCPKKYEPFDPEDVDKYVVGDDYIPIWNVPSLKRSYNDLKFTMKESLNVYLRTKGRDPTKIWREIDESIGSVFLGKESKIVGVARRYDNVGNFFEMVRFDFVVDANLDVYLMEANMSPNLSSDHFPPNRLLYENVLFNAFSVAGVGRSIHPSRHATAAARDMEVSDRSVVVHGDQCSRDRCRQCDAPQCILCRNCLTPATVRHLKLAYLEHVNRKDCKRIIPPRLNPETALEDLDLEHLSPENRLMHSWFLGKCQQDPSWC